MDEQESYIKEAVAVGMEAQEMGITRLRIGTGGFHNRAETMVASAQGQVDALVTAGFIAPAVTD
jgi:7-keto-8-aminopelargonate synthetase-like enzyme